MFFIDDSSVMLVISQNAFENLASLAERNKLIINYFLAKIPIQLPSPSKQRYFVKSFSILNNMSRGF